MTDASPRPDGRPLIAGDDLLGPLSSTWKEIDMPALNLALDTGRRRGSAQSAVWMMRILLVAQLLFLAQATYDALGGDWHDLRRVAMFVCSLAIFLPLMRWQARSLEHADEALGQSGAGALLEGRRRLLKAGVQDVSSTLARVGMVASYAFTGGLGWLASQGELPWALPAAMAVALTVVYAFGQLVRLPRLRQELAAVEELQRELAKDG